jgi:two-component system, NtrC family, response regulator PilR
MKALMAFSDSNSLMAACDALADTELEVELCSNLAELRARLDQGRIDLVFCQARLPDGTFRDLLRITDYGDAQTAVVVCSDFYDKGTYIEAMSLGAFDYVAFPFRKTEVEWIVGNAAHGSSLGAHPRHHANAPSAHPTAHLNALLIAKG